MHGFRTLALGAVLATVTGGAALACGMASSWVEADYEAVFATTIVRVETATLESDPGQIRLTVQAEVPSAGFTQASLEQVFYYVAPVDGIYEIYVMANPPAEVAAEVISSLEMSIDLPADATVKGYRIVAEDNCVTLMLDSGGLPMPEDGCAVQNFTV